MIEKLLPLKRILKRFIPKKLRGELRAELERRMLMRADLEGSLSAFRYREKRNLFVYI